MSVFRETAAWMAIIGSATGFVIFCAGTYTILKNLCKKAKDRWKRKHPPIVYCEKCQHSKNWPNGLCYAHTEPYDNERGYKGEAVCVEPDDFCSYGKRKEAT